MSYKKAIENIDLVLGAMKVDTHLSCAVCQRRIKEVFAEFKQLHTKFTESETEKKRLKELLQKLTGWLSFAAIEEGGSKEDLQKRLSKAADKIQQELKGK